MVDPRSSRVIHTLGAKGGSGDLERGLLAPGPALGEVVALRSLGTRGGAQAEEGPDVDRDEREERREHQHGEDRAAEAALVGGRPGERRRRDLVGPAEQRGLADVGLEDLVGRLAAPVVGDEALVVDAVALDAGRLAPPSQSGLTANSRSVQ